MTDRQGPGGSITDQGALKNTTNGDRQQRVNLVMQNAGKHVRDYSVLIGLKGIFLSKYQAWTYCHPFELLLPVCPTVQAVQLAELGGQVGEKNGCPGTARPGSHLRNTSGNVVGICGVF